MAAKCIHLNKRSEQTADCEQILELLTFASQASGDEVLFVSLTFLTNSRAHRGRIFTKKKGKKEQDEEGKMKEEKRKRLRREKNKLGKLAPQLENS
jgi:hypothetical protein